jgi:hypothetical protein
MIWTSKENARKWTATENSGIGNRENMKEGNTQQKMDEWSKTEYD